MGCLSGLTEALELFCTMPGVGQSDRLGMLSVGSGRASSTSSRSSKEADETLEGRTGLVEPNEDERPSPKVVGSSIGGDLAHGAEFMDCESDVL